MPNLNENKNQAKIIEIFLTHEIIAAVAQLCSLLCLDI